MDLVQVVLLSLSKQLLRCLKSSLMVIIDSIR